MSLKKSVLLTLLVLPIFTFAQWPLKVISTNQSIYTAHFLLSKVKYTSQHQLGILYNHITRPFYDNITIDGDNGYPSNYKIGQTGGIFIIRDSSGTNYNGNGNQQVLVQGSYSKYGIDFETDANDNFIVLGNIVGNNWSSTGLPVIGTPTDSTQILLCKADLKNNIVWYKIYGGSSAEYAISIKKAGDGNFIVLAQTQSIDGDVKTFKGGKDIWIFKIDGNGNILWQKTLGSDKDEIPTDLEILSDGSIVISGSADQSAFAPSPYSGKNAFLTKLTSTGDLIWTRVYGGSGDDKIKSFISVPDGFVSICTSTSNDGDYPLNAGKNDIYIFKLDTNGNLLWKKHYGNSDDDEAGDIVYTSCDDKIFASYAKQFSGDKEYFSNPPYPLFSQTAGVQIGLLNSDGSQFFYNEDNFGYSTNNDNFYFNYAIYNTLAPNDRGGFLAGGFQHVRFGSIEGADAFRVGRTFHVEEYGVPLVKANFDTSLCAGQSVWGIVFSKDTTFSDTLRNGCNIDTLISRFVVKVTNNSDSILLKDSTICYGQAFEGIPVTTSFIKSDTLNVNTNCGRKKIITKQNVFVPPLINIFLGADTTVCKDGLLLNAGLPSSSYLWQDGSSASSFLANKPGVYWVLVTDINGCKKTDSININISDLYLSILHDTTIAENNSVSLFPLTNGTVNWQYSNSLSCQACQNTVATPTATTTFYLTSEKDGCRLDDYVKVTITKEDYFYLPNAFTPNNDGINDAFKPTTNGITDYKMEVYNRWGQLVFQTSNLSEGWNGKFHKTAQPGGAYIFIVKYKNGKGKVYTRKGSFLLIR